MKLTEEKNQEYDNEYELAVNSIRGRIIQRCTELEMTIDWYIGKHFCNKGGQEFQEIVMLVLAPRVSFENKLQIFKVLVEKYTPSFISKNPSYFKDLKNIIENRNIFAHYPMNVTPTCIKQFIKSRAIELMKFKSTKEAITKKTILMNIVKFEDKEIKSLNKSIIYYNREILNLLGLNL